MKGIQYFKEEMIVPDAYNHVDELLDFVDQYQKLVAGLQPKKKAKLISMKIDPDLLGLFRYKCDQLKIPYQTKIKELMLEWI